MARRVLSSGVGSPPPSSRAKKMSTPLASKSVKKITPEAAPKSVKKTVAKKIAPAKIQTPVAPKPVAGKKPATPISKTIASPVKSAAKKDFTPTEPKASAIIKPTMEDAIAMDTKARSAERVIKQLKNKKKVAPKKTLGVGLPPSMILVDDFITPGTPMTILPRQKSRFAVAVAVFSLAVMTTAGLASFGPSHASTGPETPGDLAIEVPAAPTPPPTPVTTTSPGNFSLLGKVTTVQGDSITILTVSPNGGTKHAKEYTATFSPEASFFHQQAMKEGESTTYKVVKGDKSEIQPGYFVQLTTDDNTAKMENVTALTVNYQEMSPFDTN